MEEKDDSEQDEDEKMKKRSKSEVKISTSKHKIEFDKEKDQIQKNNIKTNSKKNVKNQTQLSNTFLKIGEKRNFKETGYKCVDFKDNGSKKFKK